MSEYPALEEMGVRHPDEITHYTLGPEGNDDVLKIHYKRQKGSFLPFSRKYKFGRSSKNVRTDSGKQEFEETYIISPFLQKAVAELDSIVTYKKEDVDRKKELISEMVDLEEIMARKLHELRKLVDALD